MKMALAQRGLGGTVSPELKEKIKTIAAQYPEGLFVSRLPSEFEAHFKETLPVRDLGFLTLMELVGALSDVLHIECKEGEQDWRIFDIDSQCLADDEETNQNTSLSRSLAHEKTSDKDELPCWDFPSEDSKNLEAKFTVVTKMETRYLGLEEPRIMQEIMKEEIPPDAVQDRSLYRLPLLDSAALVALSVEYVVSPSQFYVQIYGAETSEKLEDTMIEMRRCYGSKNVADRYIIPEASVKPGHLCCVRNSEDKWWYRGIIHRVLSNKQVEVFYVDFGNMEIVPKSYLRLLKDCYANLPAQAIPCSLAQMKPAMGDWTSGAILEFQRLCGLKLLVGVVDEYIDGVLYLFLCDTSSEEDVYFHNVLRIEGHAVISSENIPSKGFRELNPSTSYLKPNPKEQRFGELNPSTLYLQPSPEEQVGLEKADASLFQQELLQDLPRTAHSEPCKDEEGFSTLLNSSLLKTSNSADTSSLNSVPEMPYLEPVYLCPEIWDEDWKPLLCVEEEKKDDSRDNLCSSVAEFCSQARSDKGSNNEAPRSQEPEQQTTASLGSSTDSLSRMPEEFYIAIVHSQQSADPNQITLDASRLLSGKFHPLPELPAFPVDKCNEEAPSQKKVEDASSTQIIALPSPCHCSVPRVMCHSTLVFTAGLQSSPRFHIPYSPSAALGASARLAVSGGYFSLSQRQVNR
ncbi:tudor domain-containing protein 5 isoform X2 [Eublepharis macularius]|uniref:Tudor domain-containing protein 5 n=1 Tax=Eublepharis macularius TaxID=481883 RepID=A0AA97JCU5_EUBMA|nr:tudor domain-containing protein 5 isoform X2 [Eublepharis macularius]